MTRIFQNVELNAIAQTVTVAALYVGTIAGLMYKVGVAAGFIF
jgi:hypothetical protein